jgi:hypothetical protein
MVLSRLAVNSPLSLPPLLIGGRRVDLADLSAAIRRVQDAHCLEFSSHQTAQLDPTGMESDLFLQRSRAELIAVAAVEHDQTPVVVACLQCDLDTCSLFDSLPHTQWKMLRIRNASGHSYAMAACAGNCFLLFSTVIRSLKGSHVHDAARIEGETSLQAFTHLLT